MVHMRDIQKTNVLVDALSSSALDAINFLLRMSSPPGWLLAVRAAMKAGEGSAVSRFMTLATVSPSGRPHARTVVFRGWDGPEDNPGLLITTDARSQKMADLDHEARAEICWYFTAAREQLRFGGVVCASCDTELRRRVWKELSPATRASFLGPPPGQPSVSDTEDRSAAVEQEEPAAAFVLLRVGCIADHGCKKRRKMADAGPQGVMGLLFYRGRPTECVELQLVKNPGCIAIVSS